MNFYLSLLSFLLLYFISIISILVLPFGIKSHDPARVTNLKLISSHAQLYHSSSSDYTIHIPCLFLRPTTTSTTTSAPPLTTTLKLLQAQNEDLHTSIESLTQAQMDFPHHMSANFETLKNTVIQCLVQPKNLLSSLYCVFHQAPLLNNTTTLRSIFGNPHNDYFFGQLSS